MKRRRIKALNKKPIIAKIKEKMAEISRQKDTERNVGFYLGLAWILEEIQKAN